MDPKENITRILEIIDFKDDKEKFVNDFLALCQKKAFENLILTLSKEKQEALTQDLEKEDNYQAQLQEYFTPDQKLQAIQAASKYMMEQYLEEIIPTLTEEQLKNLEDFLSSTATAQNPA